MKKLAFLAIIYVCFLSLQHVTAQINNVYISEIMYDSPLQEDKFYPGEHNNGEYIKLTNPTNTTVDVSSWVLKGDESYEQYALPQGTVIPAQSILLIAYKSGSSFNFTGYYHLVSNVKILNQSSIILCNLGETLSLYDASANLVDAVAYGDRVSGYYNAHINTYNANGEVYNNLNSLHRTKVSYANGKIFPLFVTDLVSGTATPTQTENALANNTTPTVPPVTPPVIDVNPIAGYNYIITSTPLVAKSASVLGAEDELTTFQYFDGLGRPIQSIHAGITPNHSDLVTYTEYDGVGREYKQWVSTPFANNKGAFVGFNAFESAAKSQELLTNDTRPFAEIIYEPSPLNRVKEQFGAGQDWKTNNKRVQTDYQTNDESISYYFVNSSNNLEKGTNYAANTLYKTTVTDEDGNKTAEYTDKLGRVILKQAFDGANQINTYYVYNDLGQLSYVIPPKAVDELTYDLSDENSIIKQLCYLYKYDKRGNCVKKRLPGSDWIKMVYDIADRLILSQDGNQRLADQWIVNKYDALGRLLYSGVVTESTSHDNLISDLEDELIIEKWNTANDFNDIGYTCGRFTPTSLLTVNYYDNYNFVPLTDTKLAYDSGKEQEYGTKYTSAKGLLTGSRIYSLNEPTTFTASSMYYDDKGQIIQTRSSNYLGGYDISYIKYGFTGNILKSEQAHKVSTDYPPGNADISLTENTEIYTFDYDHAGRLTTTKRNGQDFTVQKYNELGQIEKKITYGGIDITTYKYNVRGWLKNIDGTHFNQELYYNDPIADAKACFNGNISGMQWKSFGETKMRGYTFEYDNLNRLLNANYGEGDNLQTAIGRFDENLIYDKMGNVEFLKRKGVGGKYNNNLSYFQIDDLEYTYNGNQLKTVNDHAEEEEAIVFAGVADFKDKSDADIQYFYDKNGNLTKDLNKGIATIQYNLLNLPQEILFINGDRSVYKYNATGAKYQVVHYTHIDTELNPVQGNGAAQYEVLTYDYNGSYIYRDHHLNMLLTPEGYVHFKEMTPELCFYAKDHLGNNRATYYVTPIAGSGVQVKDINNYYPFGMEFNEKPIITNVGFNPELNFTYNGKELQTMHGLNEYDSFARFYNPAYIRTPTQDPFSEMYYSISPYAWCGNNPVNNTDPTGASFSPIYDKNTSEFLGTDDQGLTGPAIMMDKKDFMQGMSHKDAMSKGNTIDNMTDAQALQFVNNGRFGSFINHYNSLKSRPDHKGYVTPQEGMDWAKKHPNLRTSPKDVNYLNAKADDYLYLDVSKMDFGRLTASYFKVGIEKGVNLLDYVDMSSLSSINTTYALGRTYMTMLNNNGKVSVSSGSFNAYDWDYGGSWSRAILIFANRLFYGLNNSHGVPVHVYGTGKLNNYEPYTGAGSGAEIIKLYNLK